MTSSFDTELFFTAKNSSRCFAFFFGFSSFLLIEQKNKNWLDDVINRSQKIFFQALPFAQLS